MKKILKFVPCLLVSASVLISACACTGGVDVGRSSKIAEPEIRQAEPLDPNFSVDPDKEPDEKPEDPECPDCPEKDGKKTALTKKKGTPTASIKSADPCPFPVRPKTQTELFSSSVPNE